MPVPSTPQDLITLIREKLYDNTSGIIEEGTLRNVLENIIKVLDAKFSFFSPTLTEEQYSQWNLMLDYMLRETKGVLTISSTAPTGTTAKGKYLLSDVGTYTNLGGLVTTADKINYAYFDGETWKKITVTVDFTKSELKKWNADELLQFPSVRIYDGSIYQVIEGQQAEGGDIPDVSSKWVRLNDNLIDSNEFSHVWLDSNGNIVLGLQKDGSLVNKSFHKLKNDVEKLKPLSNIEESDNSLIYSIKDNNGNILFCINSNGDVVFKNSDKIKKLKFDLERIKSILFENQSNDFISTLTDSTDNIISARKEDGTLVEKKIELENLEIKSDIKFKNGSIENLIKSLKEAGFSPSVGKSNKSEDTAVYLPFPKTISYINFDILATQLPTEKPTEVPLVFEYYDQYGNYLKKQGVISVQGTSSAGHLRKNFTLDVVDGSKLKFGAMLESDSYYLKSFYTDSFRGQSVAMYQLYMDIINSRSIPNRKAFYSGYTAPSLATGTGQILYDMSSGATYVANGFPIALYCKGEFYGVYTLVQKKNRANYDMKKTNAKEIWMDGVIDWKFFGNQQIVWTDFELRNPTVKNLDGSAYDGDNPQEIKASATKTYIQNFATRIQTINSQPTDELKRAEFLKYFDLNSIIDYFLFSNIIYNFDGFAKNWQWYTKDGVKWAIGIHDLDNIFGLSWRGEFILVDDIPTTVLGVDGWMPTSFCINIFLNETKARYNELKNLKLLNADTITDRLKNWLDIITAPMLNADLAKWSETPSYRDSKTNKAYWVATKIGVDSLTGVLDWNSSTAYVVGDKVKLVLSDDTYGFRCIQGNTNQNPIIGSYTNYPHHLGFYNSLDRVRQTVLARLSLLELTIGFNEI